MKCSQQRTRKHMETHPRLRDNKLAIDSLKKYCDIINDARVLVTALLQLFNKSITFTTSQQSSHNKSAVFSQKQVIKYL